MGLAPELVDRFAAVTDVIREPEQLRTYECDGLTGRRVMPALVALPGTTAEVQAVVRICNEAAIPFVARGAGTGLSGGALPVADGIVISLARHEPRPRDRRRRGHVVVEPGVTNLDVTRAVAASGFYYAPDPSSQQVCTIGGNVAENSGGAHCLKYGFTTNHVLAAEIVLPDGELVELSVWDEGPDLLGAFVGSEGTLGIATRLTLRVLRAPEAVRTLLAGFAHTDDAGAAVSGMIAAGILPAAIEMMDAITIEAAEAAVGADYPPGCGAVLIVELDGPAIQVEEDLVRGRGDLPRERRVRDPGRRRRRRPGRRLARPQGGVRRDGPHQPRLLRPGRRRAAHEAAGGAAPDRRALAGARPARRQRLPRGRRQPAPARALRRARRGRGRARRELVASKILEACIDAGGSITGEHGVGSDKACAMPLMFSEDDLEAMQRLRTAFDPAGLANPGKVFPTPRLCGEVPGPYRAHPLELAGLAERF